MNTQQNSFESFLNKFGTVSNPSQLTEDTALWAMWRLGKNALWTVDMRIKGQLDPQLGELEEVHLFNDQTLRLAILADPISNAFATKYENVSFAAVYAGMANSILELMLDIWSNPRFLPSVGPRSGCGSPSGPL